MALVSDQKFSTFQSGGTPTTGDIIVGLRDGINTKFNWVLPAGIDSITGTANQVLVDGSSGVPVTGDVTLTTPQDIGTTSSPTFNNLRINGNVLGSNGNTVLGFLDTISAVNYVRLGNNIAGSGVSAAARGTDTDISFTLSSKGAGVIGLVTSALTQPLLIYNGTSAQHLTRFNMANTAADRQVTFQDSDGTLAYLSDIPGGSPSALTRTNDTNVTVTLGGTPATALLQAVSLTMGWSGTLAPSRGGLGTSSVPLSGQIPIGNSGGTYTIAAITSGTNILVGNGDGSISIGITGIISPTNGGTGVNNGSSTLTLAGNLATSGAFASTFTMTGATTVTFPTTGTLATTSQLPTAAALTKTDDTNVTLTLGGTPATALLQATSLTLGWTGQLAISRGGTGINSFGTGVQTALGQNVTGSGGIVLATSPTLVTPVLGVAAATSINFGGTPLSVYAEGTFTPTFTCASVGDLSVAYGNQTGVYTRIGRMVFFNIRIACTPTFTTASGQIRLAGLPFTVSATNGIGWGTSVGYLTGSIPVAFPAGGTQLVPLAEAADTYIGLNAIGSATNFTAVNMSGLATGQTYGFIVSGCYQVQGINNL